MKYKLIRIYKLWRSQTCPSADSRCHLIQYFKYLFYYYIIEKVHKYIKSLTINSSKSNDPHIITLQLREPYYTSSTFILLIHKY